jgi:hypothetical protein
VTEPIDSSSAEEVSEENPAPLPASTASEPAESTVGTGTLIAVSCTVTTALLIAVGIMLILVLR